MIRIFKSKKLLFTPTEFLNSVARWILGVRSPTGTIRIHNTANPAEDGGASFDIDGKETYRTLDPFLKADYPKVRENALLGASMRWNGNQLDVSDEWLRNKLNEGEINADGEGVASAGEINGPEDPTTMTAGYNDTWTKGSHKPHGSSTTTDKVGVKVPVCTGAAVDALGTSISLRYRILTFDVSGRLYSVGAETQELTFTP